MFKLKNMYFNKRYIASNPWQYSSMCGTHLSHCSCLFLKPFWRSPFVGTIKRCDKNTVRADDTMWRKSRLIKTFQCALFHFNHKTWHETTSSISLKLKWPWVNSEHSRSHNNATKTPVKENLQKCFRKC